ncbi:hypothetical protein SAMN06265360_12645 [Haloechinothrix alba]|uniref:Uncharacterized protein n=1 Tax=Haloechinothrix alba TaxID=664784 RepID=A0A238ZXK0_9PSEU|nr:hypothetical protein [Haloechinothrix alba]SNR87618.1 hypothetical protein SAMN06265360_12645 [Haloechinothrix alba]
MSEEVDPVNELKRLADEFADTFSSRLQRILLDAPTFEAVIHPTSSDFSSGRVVVAPLSSHEPMEVREFPLKISRQTRMTLFVRLDCCWDSGQDFLAVDQSYVKVYASGSSEPLFRVEYLRRPDGVPASHVQVHGHRDEWVHLMMFGDRGRPGKRAKRDKVARLSEFHMPTGGHRFRPCVEDILQSLIEEFGIDVNEDWKRAVEEGRAEFRRLQLRSAVRDSPAEAADALVELGYQVVPPTPQPSEKWERLAAH